MKVIVCLDDKNGMMFNNRRQSKDALLTEKIKEIIGKDNLFVSNYSKRYYDFGCEVSTFDGLDGFALVENPDDMPQNIEELYIFHWNRHYPSDKYFTVDLGQFHCTSTEEFAGNSHDKITLEVYRKAV